ncbi:MAG: DUF4381 domain-containing protein [Myxococcota bacterium]
MNPAPQALAELRDIHLPDPISFWPLAPGWWLALAGAALLVLAVQFLRHRRRLSARRAALSELQQLDEHYSESGDGSALARGLSALLRRVTLLSSERSQVATLHGDARAQFLGAAAGGFSPVLLTGIETAVYKSASEPVPAEEALAWLDAVGGFIRRAS